MFDIFSQRTWNDASKIAMGLILYNVIKGIWNQGIAPAANLPQMTAAASYGAPVSLGAPVGMFPPVQMAPLAIPQQVPVAQPVMI